MQQLKSKEGILSILFLMLTCATFFFKGMFFEGDQFLYIALLGGLGAIILFLCPKGPKFGTWMDWFTVLIVSLYVIASFSAIYFRNSMMEVLKYSVCLVVYTVSKRLLRERKTWLLIAVYAGGVVMSAVGLGAACGMYFILGTYDGAKNLVMSLFQYHNTSAIVLAGVFLFGMSLYSRTKLFPVKLLLCAGNMCTFLTVVFSNSRGTWLMFPVMIVLYLLLMPKGEKTASFPVLFACVAAVVPFLKQIGDAFAAQNSTVCVRLMLFSVLVAVALGAVLELLRRKVHLPKKAPWIIAAILLVAVILFAVFAKTILPESIMKRITEFNLESHTVTERLTFYKDAFSVFRSYPFLGIGGGGWPYVYQHFQSYNYLANSPHSFLLILMTETGIFGICLFFFLVVVMIRCMIGLFRSSAERRRNVAPFFTFASVIFIHSMFDIDFSFFTVTVLVWTCLAMLDEGKKEAEEQPAVTGKPWLRITQGVCALLICALGICGESAWNLYYSTGQEMAQSQESGYDRASLAASLDPFNAMYTLTKGNIEFMTATNLAQQGGNDQKTREYANMARATVERAYDLNSRDFMVLQQLATVYVNIGLFDKGCETIDRLLDFQPLRPEAYETVGGIYTTVARIYQQNKDMDGIKRTMTRVARLGKDAYRAGLGKNTKVKLGKATMDEIDQAKDILSQIEALEGND